MTIELRSMGIVGDPFEAKCPKCGKTLISGKFTIATLGFSILTVQPPFECCGKRLATPLLFVDRDSAEHTIKAITANDPELKMQEIVPMESLGLCHAG